MLSQTTQCIWNSYLILNIYLIKVCICWFVCSSPYLPSKINLQRMFLLSYMDIIIIDNSLGPRKTRLDLNLYLFCNTDTQLWCPYAKKLTCNYNNLLILIGPMRTLKAKTTVTNTSFCSVCFEVCWHNSVRCCGGFKPDKNNARENRPADKRRWRSEDICGGCCARRACSHSGRSSTRRQDTGGVY